MFWNRVHFVFEHLGMKCSDIERLHSVRKAPSQHGIHVYSSVKDREKMQYFLSYKEPEHLHAPDVDLRPIWLVSQKFRCGICRGTTLSVAVCHAIFTLNVLFIA